MGIGVETTQVVQIEIVIRRPHDPLVFGADIFRPDEPVGQVDGINPGRQQLVRDVRRAGTCQPRVDMSLQPVGNALRLGDHGLLALEVGIGRRRG